MIQYWLLPFKQRQSFNPTLERTETEKEGKTYFSSSFFFEQKYMSDFIEHKYYFGTSYYER